MITELRVLPPLAIARLGSSVNPLDNYELELPTEGLGYRNIKPAETLSVDQRSGEISGHYTPDAIAFRDGTSIRPVAPFFEVFARTDDGELQPLTADLLSAHGLTPADVAWSVEAGNIKAFRRTGDPDDQIYAKVQCLSDHESHALEGKCQNFVSTSTILPLGSIRYIRPNPEYPEIRLRYTPAKGLVYGSSTKRTKLNAAGKRVEEDDPVITPDRVIYDPTKKWHGWVDKGTPYDTNPGQIYAGFSNEDHNQESWGYLDDECDGVVRAQLRIDGKILSAFARFGAGPPTFAPDGLPIRTVADELDQAMFGPTVDLDTINIENAEEIVRRAFETVRLLNTAVMNGNTVQGRTAVASAMSAQDSNDTSRLYAPIMAPTVVDNLALVSLHQGIFAALRSGSSPWFFDVLRQPEEVGDLTDKGRRKMPAMMRGADGRYLTLTRRQIDTIRKAALKGPFPDTRNK